MKRRREEYTTKKLPRTHSQMMIKAKKRESALLDYQDEEFCIWDDDYSISRSSIPRTPSYDSSNSSEFLGVMCNMCMEDKTFELFPNNGSCGHLFCSDCISKHIDAKIREKITIVTCPEPNCQILIKPEVCRDRSLVPKEVLDRWDDALFMSLIKESEKLYCPFVDCSALLVDDGVEAVTSSECPQCKRLFCAQDEELPILDDDYSMSPSSISSTPSYASSSSNEFLEVICNICMEDKTFELFPNNGSCGHLFCSYCISKHIDAKIRENITIVTCPEPNCKIVIKPEVCRDRSLVPKELLDRWDNALCESLIKGSEKFYCPFKDCSALLVDDGGKVVTSSECPHCNRLFCAQCKVSWHSELDCKEYQSLIKKGEIERSDNMLMDLAKNKKWKRCPNCNFYVERTTGCEHISCRCGYHFCYMCGNKWNRGHVCQRPT